MRYALVGLAALLGPHSARSGQDATFCPSLQRIAAAAPEKWQGFDAGQTRIGSGQFELPGAHESSATLAGSTVCRILTYKNVTSHSCYFRVQSAADAAAMANSIARIVGRCLGKGESLPRESVEGQYRHYTYTAAGLDYVVKVRPNTTISVELNLAQVPPDAQTLLELSVSGNQIGRLPDALAAADAAIKLNPALAEAHAERAYALKRLGEQQPGATAGKDRFTAAVAAYKEAIRLKPAYGPAHLGLGEVYYDNLDVYADAVSAFTQALRYFPRDVELRYKLGVSYALLDRQAEAATQLEEAVRLDGDYYEARAQLSAAFRKLGRLPEALEQIRAALRVKPDFAAGHGRLALVNAAQGNRDGAVEEYRIVERLDQSLLEELGPALQKLGVTVRPSAAGSRPAPRGACPTLTLDGAWDVFGGQPAEFSARVSGGNPNVEPVFNWTVSAGMIASGQGTAKVNIDTNGLQGRPITAYVQLLGLAKECDVHSASRTRVLGRDLP